MALASVLDSGTLRSGLSGLAGCDFLSLGDFTREEILSLLALLGDPGGLGGAWLDAGPAD